MGTISKAETLLIIGVLCVFSGAPWITGQIMPDVFSPILLLTIFLLAFCTDQLRRGELLYVSVLMTAAIATHFSHVPIAFGLILLSFGLKLIFGPNKARIWQSAALLLIPFVVAVCSILGVNWVDSRGIGFARNSNVFPPGKMDRRRTCSVLLDACLPDYGLRLVRASGRIEGPHS
jgi:hypothetical protein